MVNLPALIAVAIPESCKAMEATPMIENRMIVLIQERCRIIEVMLTEVSVGNK